MVERLRDIARLEEDSPEDHLAWQAAALIEQLESDCRMKDELLTAAVDDFNVAVKALDEISLPTQTLNLLWWQIRAREALAAVREQPHA